MYRMLRVVIQLTVFCRSSAPIENIRLIPKFKIPAFHFLFPVFFHQMGRHRLDERMPFVIILGRAGPAGFFVLSIFFPVARRRPQIIGIRQIHRHKSQLHKRFIPGSEKSVYDIVIVGKIIDRFPQLIFPINIGGAEFIGSVAIPGAEHKMGSEIIRGIFQGRKFFQKLHALRNIGIVALVIADITPEMFLYSRGFSCVHLHIYLSAHLSFSSAPFVFIFSLSGKDFLF